MIAIDDENILINEARPAEAGGTLTPQQLQIIYKNKWFKMFVPRVYGGLQLPLLQGLHLQEALAAIDGSLGWTVTLCSGANMFVGYIQQPERDIFYDEKVCLGGSGAVQGTAEYTGGSYIINGNWRYATGAPHLTHFTANCSLLHNGSPVINADGTKKYASFFFTREEVSLTGGWRTMGLKATASNSFSVSGLSVPTGRMFAIDHDRAGINDAVYTYPFVAFAQVTLFANLLGMYRHFLQECKILLTQHAGVQQALENMLQYKERFYTLVQKSVTEQGSDEAAFNNTLKQISGFVKDAFRDFLRQVTILYPATGMAGCREDASINRAFRDIFTASQHGVFH